MVEKVIEKAISDGEEIGAAFIVRRNGKEIYRCVAGLADKERGIKMQTDTICTIFSCTKIATGVAAMILIERGMLDPLMEVREVIPEFDNMTYLKDGKLTPCKRQLGVRDLLNMTSGIPYCDLAFPERNEINSLWLETEKNPMGITTAEFAKRAAKCPLLFEPGEYWLYGGSADILGAVIEAISGERFGDFLQKNIFEPLQMKDTGFYVPSDKADRKAVLYDNEGNVFNGHPFGSTDGSKRPAFESGGAGLFSTAEDYSRLGSMLACGGEFNGVRILREKTVQYMQCNGLNEVQRKTCTMEQALGHGYANLFRILENPNTAGVMLKVGTIGWDGWSGTYQMSDISERLSVTLFLQRAGAGMTPLARKLVNAVAL